MTSHVTLAAMVSVAVLAVCQVGCHVGSASADHAGGRAARMARDGQAEMMRFDRRAREIVATMTLAEKVGQMTQAEAGGLDDPADVETLFLGSVLSGGGDDPEAGNTLAAWTDVYDAVQKRAMTTRLKIPLLYGVDSVHGMNNVLGATIFPHNIGLGCTRDADLVEQIGRATAVETRATGIQWAFAPCLAVPQDVRWGRTYEGFSDDPAVVAELGAAAVRGLQGEGLGDPRGVLACAKHFLADGGTRPGTGTKAGDADANTSSDAAGLAMQAKVPAATPRLDQGDFDGDEATLRRVHLAPYPPAIAAGVGSVMPSYSSWHGEKMSGNAALLTGVLKGELGFDGFLISDYRAINQLDKDFKAAIKKSVNAGMDMAMQPGDYRAFITNLTELVEAGEVPIARVDDAVTRILRVKLAMGLIDGPAAGKPSSSSKADRALAAEVGSDAHRALARRAVAASMVVLKNDGGALPIEPTADRIHVTGRGADDVGLQCGGWTVDWQGKAGQTLPGATSILEGLRQRATGGPGEVVQVTTPRDRLTAAGADVALVVIGETPYAEFRGDRAELSLADEDWAAVREAKESGAKKVVVVLLSGRPLILGSALDDADAVVAAWLPGSEGAGVADVLFGDVRPTGTLSFAWPRSMKQVPAAANDDPLFPRGFGLTYGDR